MLSIGKKKTLLKKVLKTIKSELSFIHLQFINLIILNWQRLPSIMPAQMRVKSGEDMDQKTFEDEVTMVQEIEARQHVLFRGPHSGWTTQAGSVLLLQ